MGSCCLLLSTVPFCASDLGPPWPGAAQPRGPRSSIRVSAESPSLGRCSSKHVLVVTEIDPVSQSCLLGRCHAPELCSARNVRHVTKGLSTDRGSVENQANQAIESRYFGQQLLLFLSLNRLPKLLSYLVLTGTFMTVFAFCFPVSCVREKPYSCRCLAARAGSCHCVQQPTQGSPQPRFTLFWGGEGGFGGLHHSPPSQLTASVLGQGLGAGSSSAACQQRVHSRLGFLRAPCLLPPPL